MDVDQLRQDVIDGTIETNRLVDLVVSQQKVIQQLQAQVEKLQAQVEKLKAKNPTDRLDEPFSEKAEEKRQAKAKGKRNKRKTPKRRGRVSTAEKIARASRTELVYPDDCDPQDCKLSHTRVAWRLEDGRAVLVAYEIYRQGNRYGQPPGVPGRGEFGMEILIALAYQVYTLGLSLDKACQVLGPSASQSDQADAAGSCRRQIPRVDRLAAVVLPHGKTRCQRQAFRHGRSRASRHGTGSRAPRPVQCPLAGRFGDRGC